MYKNENIIAMIPARIGSTRLKKKNLALVNGKPLIYYAISASKETGIFSKVVLNSDNKIFEKIAKRYDIEFYNRREELGSSDTKSDDVVFDFMNNFSFDILVWVNPIAPLQTKGEIKLIIDYFIDEQLDSLITVKDEYVHCLYEGNPVNYKVGEIFSKTQDLKPVKPFVYSIMMWRKSAFLTEYESKGFGLFCGKFGSFSVSKESSVIIKTEEDLLFAESILKLKEGNKHKLEYDEILCSGVF